MDEERTADPDLPYMRRVTCPKCGKEKVIKSVMPGITLALTARRLLRLGCLECTPEAWGGPDGP